MIGLDLSTEPAAPLKLEFDALAVGKGEKREVPVWFLAAPTTAVQRSAYAVARTVVPGQDEGEGETDYRARLKHKLAAYGADQLIQSHMDLSSIVSGLVTAIALTEMAKALLVSWDGFGDQDGQPLEPSPLAIEAAMRHPTIADTFQTWSDARLAEIVQEGNG